VIVGRGRSASGREAFRWTAGSMVGLGDLPGGTFDSLATAVNTTGSIVAGNGNSAGGFEAFRWTSGGMVGLGFPAGTTTSFAYGMSSTGARIVGTATNGASNVAFLWDATNGMRSLEDILAGQGVSLGGWTIQVATAISADGTWVVGYGLNPNGNTEAFRARIP
jgi:probable HAF family extracellular repeat protein